MVASGKRVPHPDEQRTLVLLRTLVASGANDAEIAGQLNAMRAYPRRARYWSPQSVRGVRLLDDKRRADRALTTLTRADLEELSPEDRRAVREALSARVRGAS
jgi:hypothetical protein